MHRLAHGFLAVLLLFGMVACSEPEDEPSPEPSAEATSEAAADRAPQFRTPDDGRSVAARVEDAALAARVVLALTEANDLQGYAFEAEATGSRVVLHGDVAARDAYRRAAEVAREVDGVGEVVNQVTVGGEEVAAAEPEPPADTAAVAEATEPVPAEEQADEAPDQAAETEAEEDASAEEQAQEDEAVYHTVRGGQSLWVIAREYDVSIDQIRRLNDLRGSNIRPGQRLRIK